MKGSSDRQSLRGVSIFSFFGPAMFSMSSVQTPDPQPTEPGYACYDGQTFKS